MGHEGLVWSIAFSPDGKRSQPEKPTAPAPVQEGDPASP